MYFLFKKFPENRHTASNIYISELVYSDTSVHPLQKFPENRHTASNVYISELMYSNTSVHSLQKFSSKKAQNSHDVKSFRDKINKVEGYAIYLPINKDISEKKYVSIKLIS